MAGRSEISQCNVFVEKLNGDPFTRAEAFVSVPVGSINASGWASDLSRALRAESEEAPEIPSVGVVARVEFLDFDGGKVAEGWIYLPDGDLILSHPKYVKMRLPKLNGRVIDLMKANVPDTLLQLEEQMKEKQLDIERLTR